MFFQKLDSKCSFQLSVTGHTLLKHVASRITLKNFLLVALQHVLRRSSRSDWKTHVQSVAWKAHAVSSKPNFDSKAMFGFVRQLSKKSSRVPKAIQLTNGMMAQNHAQIANRWQSHFSNLFLGKPTSWQELQDAQERFHQSLPLIDKMCLLITLLQMISLPKLSKPTSVGRLSVSTHSLQTCSSCFQIKLPI
jgi:hypothetical protein